MLKFNVRGQNISRIDNFEPAEKSVNYLIAEFNFKTEDWLNTQKTAVFENKTTKQRYDALLDEGHCVVPWEAIDRSGKVGVAVYGVNGAYRITTEATEFKVNPTLYGGSATQEPTPNVYEQILGKLNNIDGGTFKDWEV